VCFIDSLMEFLLNTGENLVTIINFINEQLKYGVCATMRVNRNKVTNISPKTHTYNCESW
jgi:hypothetical protein